MLTGVKLDVIAAVFDNKLRLVNTHVFRSCQNTLFYKRILSALCFIKLGVYVNN